MEPLFENLESMDILFCIQTLACVNQVALVQRIIEKIARKKIKSQRNKNEGLQKGSITYLQKSIENYLYRK